MGLILLWILLLAAILATPYLLHSSDPGDDLTRNTVRLGLLYYVLATSLMLLLRREEWTGVTGRGRSARWCWTLAWGAYLIHVVMAFHYFHDWSHAKAVEHVEQTSGFGEGIYFSYLFTLLWTVDVMWWWLRPEHYATRSWWIDRGLHGYMAFIVFNGTVVFEEGLVRWIGMCWFAFLAVVMLYRHCRR